ASGFPGRHRTGFQRLEFEAVTDVKALSLIPGMPPPNPSVSDISTLIHTKAPDEPEAGKKKKNPWSNGYLFQFGGMNNTVNRIQKSGTVIWKDPEPKMRIVPDKVHRIVVENDKGTLRFYVDGKR